MNSEANVVHVNVIDFMANVSGTVRRLSQDRPFVVANERAARACVLDTSRRAVREGLRVGMQVAEARKLVPGLEIVAPEPELYERANGVLERLCARYTPVLQNDSGGHFYLDLKGSRLLFGPAIDVAVRLKNEITEALSIEPAMTVSSNKLVSKVGTRSIRPAGLVAIGEGEERSFLTRQDVDLLPGVGPKIRRVLALVGIRQIGDLAALSPSDVVSFLGSEGLSLHQAAQGYDDSSVANGRLSDRTLRRAHVFETDELDLFAVRGALVELVAQLGFELRRQSLNASQAHLALEYTDAKTSVASERWGIPRSLDRDLLGVADRLFERVCARRVRVRRLVLELSNLSAARTQLDLFVPGDAARTQRLQDAIDRSKARFGELILTRASAVTHDRSALCFAL